MPSPPRMACIVEGDGDNLALPILLRRIASALYPAVYVAVDVPLRKPRSNIVRAGGIENLIELVARKTSANDAILVLIDADDDCPAKLGPELLRGAGKLLQLTFDPHFGGFGQAPKFPHPMELRLLLRIARRFDDRARSVARPGPRPGMVGVGPGQDEPLRQPRWTEPIDLPSCPGQEPGQA